MNAISHYHTKQSKSERERQMLYDITYMCYLKYDTNEHIYRTGTDSQLERTDLWLPREQEGRIGSLRAADANHYL